MRHISRSAIVSAQVHAHGRRPEVALHAWIALCTATILGFACCPNADAGAAAVPEVVCPLTSSPPTVDGALSAEEWTLAAVIERFHATVRGALAPAATRLLLCHDPKRLYVGAECRFRPGHQVKSFIKRDGGDEIWRDDCLEIFIAPDLLKPEYIHVIVNSKGRLYDSKSGDESAAWDLHPSEAATRIINNTLVIEMAIAFAALDVIPKTGDVWGIKFCRTHWDRSPTTDRERPGNVFTSTVAGGGSYHDRPYGRLIFGARTARTQAILKRLKGSSSARAHAYHRLEEARRANVWAKPCEKLVRDGVNFGERLIFRDTGTGAEVWRVTFNAGPDGVSYANTFPWNADGSLLMFSGRKRIDGGWHMLLSADGTRISRPKGYGSMTHPRWTRDDPESVLCSSGRDLFRINVLTGKKTGIASLPEHVQGRLSFGPKGVWAAACKRGFGKGGELTLIDLKTKTTRVIPLRTASKDFGGDWLYSGGVTYVGETPHVRYSLNHLPHLSAEHKYQQWTMNLETGEYRLVKYLSHGGTSPNRDRKVGFWGGSIHTTDWFGGDKKFVMRIGTGGHIAWMSSPEWCLAGTSGAPNSSRFGDQLVQVFVDTGNWCRIAYGQSAQTTYASHLFTNTSPDGTKGEYTSTMLGPKDVYWAVVNRPEPPERVKAARSTAGVQLNWSAPGIRKEIKGYRVWRSDRSGGPYALVSGRNPVKRTQWTDTRAPADEPLFYVLTSVEHSTLESRRFSREVAVPAAGRTGWPGKVRRYVEAETGTAQHPMAEDFSGTASCDRFVAHRHGEGEGKLVVSVNVPRAGRYLLWARVRGPGRLRVTCADRPVGSLGTARAVWSWTKMSAEAHLPTGDCELALVTEDKGCAVDKLLLTDDPAFVPRALGDTTRPAPGPPAGLRAKKRTRFDVALAWRPSPDPEFHHYQVYRGRTPGFQCAQENLVGSPDEPAFLDWGLEPGAAWYYGVTAVDTWGHESKPARVTAATQALARRTLIELEAEKGRPENGRHKTVKDPAASAGEYVVMPAEVITRKPFRLVIPFRVEHTDRYVVWLSLCPVADAHVYLNVDVDGKNRSLMYVNNTQKGKPAKRFTWRPLGAVGGPTPLVWDLSPGKHRLALSLVGAAGFANRITAVDRAIVTNDLSFVPEGPIWDW